MGATDDQELGFYEKKGQFYPFWLQNDGWIQFVCTTLKGWFILIPKKIPLVVCRFFIYPDLKIFHLSYNTFQWNYFLSKKSLQIVDSKLLLFYKCHFYIVINTTNEILFTCVVLG